MSRAAPASGPPPAPPHQPVPPPTHALPMAVAVPMAVPMAVAMPVAATPVVPVATVMSMPMPPVPPPMPYSCSVGAGTSLPSPGYIPPADVQTAARLGASGNGSWQLLARVPIPAVLVASAAIPALLTTGLASFGAGASAGASYVTLALLLTPRTRRALSRSPCGAVLRQALAFLVVVFWVRSHSASYYDQEPRPSVPLWIARPGAFTLPFFAAAYLTQLASGNGRLAGHVWCAACILIPATGAATMFLRPAAAIESELDHHTSSSPLKFAVTFSLGLVHSAQPRSTSFKLLLAAAVVALGSSVLAVAYLRTGDGRWVRTVLHPVGLPFALPALLPHAIEAEFRRGVTRALQRLRGAGRRRHRGGTHVRLALRPALGDAAAVVSSPAEPAAADV